MMIKIVHGRPPIFNKIAAVFPMAYNPNVIFAYLDTVYMPGGGQLSIHLQHHEAVHLQRQGGTTESADIWWGKYLMDADFRYHEELLAHRAEYRSMVGENSGRQIRRQALKLVAKRLSSPLYGRMRTADQCAKDILGELNG